uniref:Uncharacterized protein n=1 Tax=Picea glauca TaxID=3330 RepID=A0A117NI84_PICGL|nr:hypothetical protein ABT39_MTgene2773 [Picea glauca]
MSRMDGAILLRRFHYSGTRSGLVRSGQGSRYRSYQVR